MRFPNPFQMNDWESRRFLSVVAVAYMAMWGSIGWELLGLSLPIVRPMIGLLCVVFIPGMAILRALNIHEMGSIKTAVISVVISLATVMLIGLLLNSFRVVLGIDAPISTIPLMTALSILVAILCFHILRRDKETYNYSMVDIRDIVAPPHMLLMAIVIITISGTILLNTQGENFVILLALVVMSLAFVLIGFDIFFSPRFYPAVVFSFSLSLLLHTSLISNYVWGADIQFELFLSNSVLSTGVWDPSVPSTVNGMLSVVVLAPWISCACNLDLIWTFKIVYPLLFSLVPLGLYQLYREQTDDKKAVLASLFFISLFSFFREMTQLARQEIAELVLVGILIVVMERRLNSFKRMSLLILLGFALVVSHYGLTYLFIVLLMISWFILRFVKQVRKRDATQSNLGRYATYCLLVAIIWYTYISSGESIHSIVGVIRDIVGASFGDLLSTQSSQGLALIASPSPAAVNHVSKVVHLLPQLLISIGVVFCFSAKRRARMKVEFLALSGASYIIMVAGLLVPFLASSLNASRLYQIGLILLAPFCVTGWLMISAMATKRTVVDLTKRARRYSEGLLSVFIVMFLLFNTGLVYQLVGQPTSFSLDSRMDTARFNSQEIAGADWIMQTKGNHTLYADQFRRLLIGSIDWYVIDWNKTYDVTEGALVLPPDIYIYLGTINVLDGNVMTANKTGVTVSYQYADISQMLDTRSRIFDNGGSMIYY